RAKGIDPRTVLVKHVLRNSLIPIVTLFGLDFAAVLGGGAILTETVFDLHGVGQYAEQSITTFDLPPIMGVTLFGAFFIVFFSARFEGEVLYKGEDLLKMSETQLRRIRGNEIAMIFQDPMTSMNPVYRVGAQIVEAIRTHEDISQRTARNRAVQLLRQVGIPHPEERVDDYPHQFSGGMRQRAMIAMALSNNPDVLIADEPTTALDVTIQAQIIELIDKLKDDFNSSVILITHDLGVVADVADDIAVMYAGRIVEYGAKRDLFYDPQHPYTWGLLGSIPRLDRPKPEKLHSISGAQIGRAAWR